MSASSTAQPLKARFPVDPQMQQQSRAPKSRPGTASAASRPATGQTRPQTAGMSPLEQQISTDPAEYQLDIDALRSHRPSSEGESSYRYVVDPNQTRAGERAAATVSLLIPGSTLRPTYGFGRVQLKSSAKTPRPQTARLHSSLDTSRRLIARHPTVKSFVPDEKDAPVQGLKESPSAKALLRQISSPKRNQQTASPGKPAAPSNPWHSLYGFPSEPHFRFVNLQATNNVISAGGIANNSNIQLCFILSSQGFAQSLPSVWTTEEDSSSAAAAGGEADPEEEIVEYINASGEAVRFRKAPRTDGRPSVKLKRQKIVSPEVEPSITLTFQTHLPPLFSLVDDTHYPTDGSVCPSRAGLVHALALQYEKLHDKNRVKVGDIRLLRFSLESLLYSLEHFSAYLTRMDWTLHYIAISMKGPLLIFVGSYMDVHCIVAASARMGGEVEEERKKNGQSSGVPPPAPSAWLVHKSKLYILHLPRDLSLSALRCGATKLAPLPPGFGDAVLETLREWEGERVQREQEEEEQRRRREKKMRKSPSQKQSSLAFAHRPQTAGATTKSTPTSPQPNARPSPSPAKSSPPVDAPTPLSPSASPLASLGESLVHEDFEDPNGDVSEDEWERVEQREKEEFRQPQRPRTAGVRIPSAHHPASPQPGGSVTARPSTSGPTRSPAPAAAFQQSLRDTPISPGRADHEGYFGKPGDAPPSQTPPASHRARSPSVRTPRAFMRITGAVEDLHPPMQGLTNTVSYISENLLRDSYHSSQRGSLLVERRTVELPKENMGEEEKESNLASAGASVYVKVGDAAVKSSPAAKVSTKKGVASASTAASSPPLSTNQSAHVKRSVAYVPSKPVATPVVRPASPVLSFFGSADVRAIVEATKEHAVEAQAKASPVEIMDAHARTVLLGTQHGEKGAVKVIREVALPPKADDQMSANSSVQVPEQTLLEYRAQPRPAPKQERPPPPVRLMTTEAHDLAQTGEFHVEESPISSTSSPDDSPQSARTSAHHESYSLAEALASPEHSSHVTSSVPQTAPAAASKRPQSAFIRRTSGSAAVIISGKQMSARPASAVTHQQGGGVVDSGSNFTSQETSEQTSAAQSRPTSAYVPMHESELEKLQDASDQQLIHHPQQQPEDDGLQFDESHPVTVENAPAVVPALSPALFNFTSAQASPPVTARHPQEALAFSTFISATDARTQLPTQAVVHIPPGHPLAFNRPMSALELQNEGVDLLNRTCGLDTCGNKLYAVSGLGYQLIKCVWCRAVIYCSSGCMVEDWMRGVHPLVCADAQALAHQRAEKHAAREPRAVDQIDGWMQVTAAPRSPSRPHSAVRTRSRSRSPTRSGVIITDEPLSAAYSTYENLHDGQQAFDEMLELQELGADDIPYTGSYDSYDSYDTSYLPPSEAAEAELLRAQKDAERNEVAAAPNSLHSAMHQLSQFPAQPALKLSTRSKTRPLSSGGARPGATVKDIVLSGEEYSAYVPAEVVPTVKSSDAHQLETQRAYAVLYDELRAGEQHGSSSSKPLSRPASAKLARPSSAHGGIAQPQDPSRFLSRFQARLSSALTPSQQASAGVAQHGANVLAKAIPYQMSAAGKRAAGGAGVGGIKTGGGGALTAQALAPSIALGVEPSTIHYLPLARNTQLYAKTRGTQVRPQSAHTRTSTNGMAQPLSLTAAAAGVAPNSRIASGQRTVSGAFSKNFVAPRYFGGGNLDLFMRLTQVPSSGAAAAERDSGLYSTRGVEIASPRPQAAVIPHVDLRRAISAARPTSARLASNGRMSVLQ